MYRKFQDELFSFFATHLELHIINFHIPSQFTSSMQKELSFSMLSIHRHLVLAKMNFFRDGPNLALGSDEYFGRIKK